MKSWSWAIVSRCLTVAVVGFGLAAGGDEEPQLGRPTSSSPVAISSDDRFLWAVNPDNGSVSVLKVGGDVNRKVAEIAVGAEPQRVAITPDNRKVYVTNQRSGTLSVIDAETLRVVKTIKVGTEPLGCALTPDGERLFVANSSSDDVSVVETHADVVIRTIAGVGPKPSGVAVTGGPLGRNKVYVTQFLAQLRNDARSVEEKEGRDDGKEGRVTVIDAASGRVLKVVSLNPLADTGFKSNGSVLDRVPPTSPATFTFTTAAFPNLLQSIAIRGDRAYLPNTAASPNGPSRFNVNVQGFLSVFDTRLDVDSGQTINMNRGVDREPVGKRLFITNPVAAAFKRSGREGFVVAAAVNRLVRVVLDAAGTPTINAPTSDGDPGNVVRIEVGKNPQGVVLNSTDTRAYVMNYVSRDVSVVDISGDPSSYREIARLSSASLPAPGTLEAAIHRGHELFNTSVGPPGTVPESSPPAGRMSNFGWGSCFSCHPNGLTDGVTWMLGGPRQTVSMESTFQHPQPASCVLNANFAPMLPSCAQRMQNFSAGREEIGDLELNIRGLSGGQGLIARADGSQDPCVFSLRRPAGSTCPDGTDTTTGRSADLDAIVAYLAFGVRAPISPPAHGDVAGGRALFAQAHCQSCHGGPNWTRSRVDYTPPPAPSEIVDGQLVRFLFTVGTFDPDGFNEVRAGQTSILVAPGAAGFNIPSLLSVFAGAPYLHNGSAQGLEDVLENVTHRSTGTGGTDTLGDPNDREALAHFLRAIDASTPPFP